MNVGLNLVRLTVRGGGEDGLIETLAAPPPPLSLIQVVKVAVNKQQKFTYVSKVLTKFDCRFILVEKNTGRWFFNRSRGWG